MHNSRLNRVTLWKLGRVSFPRLASVSIVLLFSCPLLGQEKDFNAYPEHVVKYLKRLYVPSEQQLAYREDYPGGFERWQQEARAELQIKLGMDRIAASAADHRPAVQLDEAADFGEYTRQGGVIETEPDVRIPFWLLKPKGEGRWPLGVFPHGHDRRGHDTTAGVYATEAHEKKAIGDAVIEGLDGRFPGLAGLVEMVDVATPTTFERYTGNWRGSFEGWLPTPGSMTNSMRRTLPGLQDFYMAGQWVAPGGGLPSGVMTGREVVQLMCHQDGKKFRVPAS